MSQNPLTDFSHLLGNLLKAGALKEVFLVPEDHSVSNLLCIGRHNTSSILFFYLPEDDPSKVRFSSDSGGDLHGVIEATQEAMFDTFIEWHKIVTDGNHVASASPPLHLLEGFYEYFSFKCQNFLDTLKGASVSRFDNAEMELSVASGEYFSVGVLSGGVTRVAFTSERGVNVTEVTSLHEIVDLFEIWLNNLGSSDSEPETKNTERSLLDGSEIRVTSDTGGQKGAKLCQLGDVAPEALIELGEIAGFGAQKYDQYNYLKGYPYSLSYNAALRHLMGWWNGQDLDPESGKSHLMHAAWHMAALFAFQHRGIGTDDRPTAEYMQRIIEEGSSNEL